MKDRAGMIASQKKKYRARFLKYGDSVLSTFQNNTETQTLRFEYLLKNISPQPGPFRLHDIGSGLGDLHGFLLERGIKHEYSGTEIVPEMIAVSRRKFPEITVYERDFLDAPADETYDFVVLNGTLNLRSETELTEQKEYAFALIEKMFQHANAAIAFNFLTSRGTFSVPELCYFDPAEIFDFCQGLSRFVTLDHSSPLYEATVTVFQPGYLQSRFPQTVYQKYFPS